MLNDLEKENINNEIEKENEVELQISLKNNEAIQNTPPHLRYVLIANVDKNKIICDYPNSISLNTLFEKIVKSKYNLFDQGNKIKANDGLYYFIVTKDKFFFFVHTDAHYSQKSAFEFIDHFFTNGIISRINVNGVISDEGKQCLKELFTNYEISNDSESLANVDSIEDEESEIDIQIDNKENNKNEVEKVFENVNNNLNSSLSSIHIHINSKQRHHLTDDNLKKIKLWRSIKLYTIFSCIGTCIILYIILPFFINSSGSILGPNPSNSTNINIKSSISNSI